jgi:anti-anti-sigma factor
MDIVTVSQEPLIYRLSGRLTFKDNDAFSTVVDEMAARSHAEIMMDIENLDFIDSFGIGLFLVAAEAVERSGNTLTILKPQGTVKRLFRLAKLDSILHIQGECSPKPVATPAPAETPAVSQSPIRRTLSVSAPTNLDDHTVGIELTGRFTFTDHDEFEALAHILSTCANKEVRIGLSGLEFMDSAGLSMLLIARDEIERLGGTLALISPRGKVAHLLRLASVDKVVPVHDEPAP